MPLPKPAEGVEVAGNGRWLVIAMHGFNGLAVYDADRKKITHSIRLPTSDFLYAAGGGTVLVYSKDAGTLISFDVATGKRVKSDRFPGPGVLVRMVMGRARGDRALLRVAKGTDSGAQCHYLMLDTGALAVVPWKPVGDGAPDLGSVGPNSSCPPEAMHLSPDGMLGLVAEWSQSSELVLYRFNRDRSGEQYDVKSHHPGDFGSLIVGDDGRVYTELGIVFDRDFVRKSELPAHWLIPGIGGIFYLGVSTRGTLTVFPCGQTTPLVDSAGE